MWLAEPMGKSQARIGNLVEYVHVALVTPLTSDQIATAGFANYLHREPRRYLTSSQKSSMFVNG